MEYANGRKVKVHDRVLATGPSGKFIGQVVAEEGEHLRVAPLHSQAAHYIEPAATLHLEDVGKAIEAGAEAIRKAE